MQLQPSVGTRMRRSCSLCDCLSKLSCNNWMESCEDLKKCVALTCFGKFLHTMIAGWDDTECARTYDSICQHTLVMKNVKLVLSAKAGKQL